MRPSLNDKGWSACNYTDEEREFLAAIQTYKSRHQRPYLTDPEVLAIAHSLGYRLVAEPAEPHLPRLASR